MINVTNIFESNFLENISPSNIYIYIFRFVRLCAVSLRGNYYRIALNRGGKYFQNFLPLEYTHFQNISCDSCSAIFSWKKIKVFLQVQLAHGIYPFITISIAKEKGN